MDGVIMHKTGELPFSLGPVALTFR